MDKLEEALQGIPGIEFFENAELDKYTTLRLRARGNLVKFKEIEGLKSALKLLKKYGQDYIVLGWGANQVLPQTNTKFYLKNELAYSESTLREYQADYVLPSSVPLNLLTQAAIKHGLSGWEVFTGVPATLGGAIAMNAGTKFGEIGPMIKEIKFMNREGSIVQRKLCREDFEYRKCKIIGLGDIILEAQISHGGKNTEVGRIIKEYYEFRRRTQPLSKKTCGCVFKNNHAESKICRAGQYIDIMGLKGLTVGDMSISLTHGNFFENNNQATKEQMEQLIKIVNKESLLNFGVEFELEAKLI